MEIWLSLMIFILGLCCGSFVNMLVYRTAEQYELESRKFKVKSKNRSFCDYCGRQLFWYENIPVVSWLIQKGRTRCCGKKLPVAYPIVEIMTGILFLSLFRSQISDLRSQILILVLGLIIIVFLVFSAVFDIKYMILPDFSTIILIVCGLILLWEKNYDIWWQQLLAAGLSFGFLGLLYLLTRGKGMGLGDVKLAVFMGLFLGYQVVAAFYVAFITGALVGLILMISKKADKKTLLPFGPFLILGILVAWFFENQIPDLWFYLFIR